MNEFIKTCAATIAGFDGASDLPAQEAFTAMIGQVATTVAYKEIRTEWVSAYVATRGCSEKSGQNRWAELCTLCGFTKPQSPEAALKQAQRAKRGASTPKAEKPLESPAKGQESAIAGLAVTLDAVQREMLVALIGRQWALLAALADKAGEAPMVDEVIDV